MKKLFTGSIAVALGLVTVLIGLSESVALLKFWWGVRSSLGIFSSDIIFLSWIVLQTLLYIALTASGVALVLMRSKVRVTAALLLYCDAAIKVLAPPVTRTDILLAAVSLLVASILVSGFGRRLFKVR